MEENEEKTLSKKELKLKAQEMKLEEKQRKAEEKAEIKAEKERRKNSFGRKVRNFFITIILVIILLLVGFYFGKDFLTKKEKELANEKMGQTYQTALIAIDSKDYKKAIELLKSIDSSYEKYSEVNKKLKEVEQLYLNEYLVDSDKYLKDKKYSKAIEALEKIDDEFKSSDLVIEKLSEIHIAKINDEVKELEKDNDNIKVLKFLLGYDEISEEVNDVIDDLVAKYKNQFVLESREKMVTEYNKVKSNIDTVKKMLPDDKDIKALVEELEKVEPAGVSLLTLKSNVTEGKLTLSKKDDAIKDFTGKEYSNYILSEERKFGDSTNEVEYNLDKKYTKLEGSICVAEGQEKVTDSVSSNLRVTIYSGNKVIYFSDKFTEDKMSIDFSVDVSDVKDLRIVFNGSNDVKYFMGDPLLTIKK
ncbi:MAG: hypothetical protein HFJ25_02760 [Clostridia bacterium]|nr:hypothetical protein [Clostridia bacterium]